MSVCLLVIMLDTDHIMLIFKIVHFVNITVGTIPQVDKYFRLSNDKTILIKCLQHNFSVDRPAPV